MNAPVPSDMPTATTTPNRGDEFEDRIPHKKPSAPGGNQLIDDYLRRMRSFDEERHRPLRAAGQGYSEVREKPKEPPCSTHKN